MKRIDWLADVLRRNHDLHPTASDVAGWLDCSRPTARRMLADIEAAEVIKSYRLSTGRHWCAMAATPLPAEPVSLTALREMGEATTATYARRTGRTSGAALRALARLRRDGQAMSTGWPCVWRAVSSC